MAAATNEPTTFFGFGDYSLGCDSTPTQPINELDEYLQQPLEKVDDALKWWSAQQKKYPNLSRMALDYLSAPASSTAVERVFSQARQLLHFTRNRLSSASIRAFLCLGSWSRHDLIDTQDFLGVVMKTKKRKHSSST
ncbi:hypothetical protein CY34DRAFT_70720 [Suillus luteus UH-Slu-Lm8-n1]|uniref:HAT C-terminal dimerisation domain-containing protein n=1 Tax=Suillus luteus UH-Slu-Lm8-n1 TaxID=930992 RepID=A0A0D0AFV5_9AGAM|nr:hypothetical protein CY34DRAFT_70720 [Suillus luteus UH-Slu-Lm8-n1]